jgi:hypothetical protein
MGRLVGRALDQAAAGNSEAATRRLMLVLLLKLPVLAALVWVAVRGLKLQAAPFAVGLSALVLALLVAALSSHLPKEAV